MERTIELKPKQIEMLTSTQADKAKIQRLFAETNQKEIGIVELILEMNDVKGVVTKYDIKDNKLVITLLDKAEKTAKPKETK